MRSREGGRDGISGRGEGGCFFFADLARGNRQSGRDWGLKLERARLMTDEFCAAGSQAQRGGVVSQISHFAVGGSGWGVAAGLWAPGSGHCWDGTRTRGVWSLPSIPWWSGGAAAGGRGNPTVQTQDWQTVDKRTAPDPNIDTHSWRRGSTAPPEYTEHRPDRN